MTFKIKLLIKHMNLFEGCADEAIDCFKNCPIKSIEQQPYRSKGLIGISKKPQQRLVMKEAGLKNNKLSLKQYKPFKAQDKQNFPKSAHNIDDVKYKQFFTKPSIHKISYHSLPRFQTLPCFQKYPCQAHQSNIRSTPQCFPPEPLAFVSNQSNKLRQKQNEINMKGKQNNLEEKKIKFSYVPVYEAKTHIKSQTQTMTIPKTLIQEPNQYLGKQQKIRYNLMKKYSYQNFEEKAIDYSHISKSLQYAESPKLKKVVSEKVVYQNYNPQMYNEKKEHHKRQQSQFNLKNQSNEKQEIIRFHSRHNSDFHTINSHSRQDLVNSNKVTESIREEYFQQKRNEILHINRNLIDKVQTQKLIKEDANSEQKKIAEFNLLMLNVVNLQNMDFCRKTQSIHDSSEKEDQFSQIIELSQNTKSENKKLLTLPLISQENKFSEPFNFSKIKFKKNREKRKSSLSST